MKPATKDALANFIVAVIVVVMAVPMLLVGIGARCCRWGALGLKDVL